jgi:hypothetical protein
MLINAPCRRKIRSQNTLRFRCPNGETIDSTHTKYLDIPELSEAAPVAHVFPDIENDYVL